MSDTRHKQISERAHAIWRNEGQPDGQAASHWQQAEHELDADRSDVAAETDYVMQVDGPSRAATKAEQPDLEPPTKLKRTASRAKADPTGATRRLKK